MIGLDKFGGIYPPREGDLVVIEDREVENLVHEVGDRYLFREIIVIQDILKGKLKEIVAGMHEEDNPVIMVAKYKR